VVAVEGCRRFCSELRGCYSSQDINIIVARKKIDVACGMHIVKEEGMQSFLRKPEQGESLWRLLRIM